MTDVLVLTDHAEEYATLARAAELEGIRLHVAERPGAVDAPGLRAEVALAKPAFLAEIIGGMDNLRWVQSTFAGVDALIASGMPQSYALTGVKDVFGPLMSEYVIAHMIARERGFDAMNQAQREHRWAPSPYRGLSGLTLGVAGLGSIGRHIARSAGYFGMRVLGYKRSHATLSEVERVFAGNELHEFLRRLDYLVLTLPGTAESRHLIDAGALAAMRPRACLINVGRGAVVCEADLAAALAERTIAAAVLDVFETEPLPAESPLWELGNCTITPHVAADSFPRDIVEIFARNWRRYRNGQSLLYTVDFERGY